MNKKVAFMLLVCIFNSIASLNAQPPFSHYFKDGLYQFNDTFKLNRNLIFTQYASQFGLNTDNHLVLTAVDTLDTLGNVHDAYTLFYKGYPVENTRMNVFSQYGVVLQANGFFIKGLNINVSTPVPEGSALITALNYINAPRYGWQDTAGIDSAIVHANADSDFAWADTLMTKAFNPPHGSLVITTAYGDTSFKDSSHYHFCWKFVIPTLAWDTIVTVDTLVDSTFTYQGVKIDTSIGYLPSKTYTIYVDALTNTFFSDASHVFGAFYRTESCSTPYNGTQYIEVRTVTIGINKTPEDHRNIRLYNPVGGAWSVPSKNKWNAYTGTQAGAMWGVERAWEYFNIVHGRGGSNGLWRGINILTNVFNSGSGDEELKDIYFDPASSINIAHTGTAIQLRGEDYIGLKGSPAQLDVLGHEVSHAYEYFFNSLDGSSDAKALDEGFCDINGMLISNWVLTGSVFPFTPSVSYWAFGQWATNGAYARYFADPHSDFPTKGWSYYNDPVSTTVNQYTKSGVLRHFFYLLAQGGSFRGVTVPALNVPIVEHDLYVTMSWWCWSNMNFYDFRNQYLAENIYYYGQCSKQYKAAALALQAVNLGTAPLCANINTVITGPSVIPNKHNFSTHAKMTATPSGTLTAVNYAWNIPESWNVTYDPDNSGFTINSTTNYSSKQFSCIVTYSNNSSETIYKTVHFVTDADTGLKHIENPIPNMTPSNENQVRIYPVPAERQLSIAFSLQPNNATVQLYDITGKEVYFNTISQLNTLLTLPTLSSGQYIIKIKGNNLNVIREITIKQ